MNLYSYRIFFALAFFIILCLAATYSFTLEDAQITYRYALRYSEGFSWGTWNRDEVPIEADSICMHGDTPGSVQIAKKVKTVLESSGINIVPLSELI